MWFGLTFGNRSQPVLCSVLVVVRCALAFIIQAFVPQKPRFIHLLVRGLSLTCETDLQTDGDTPRLTLTSYSVLHKPYISCHIPYTFCEHRFYKIC